MVCWRLRHVREVRRARRRAKTSHTALGQRFRCRGFDPDFLGSGDGGDRPRTRPTLRHDGGREMTYRSLRTPLLVAHIASSVGFLGAVAVFFCLAVAGFVASDGRLVNASYAVMPQVTWVVIVPLGAASLAVGVLQSALSPWGLFRHYWVIVKLAMTVVILGVLMVQTPDHRRPRGGGTSISRRGRGLGVALLRTASLGRWFDRASRGLDPLGRQAAGSHRVGRCPRHATRRLKTRKPGFP